MHLKLCLIVAQFVFVIAKNKTLDIDRYIISCHTTDFECFRRQYIALRDHVLFGNSLLGIQTYHPFQYMYGDSGTCIKITGIEESQLAALSIDSHNKEYSLVLEMPIRIQQVKNDSKPCAKPDKAFEVVGTHIGPLRRFTGNASVQITYPYTLKKLRGEVYINMSSENLDVLLDIPDLSHFNKNNKMELRLYEWSEWAYHVAQHIDVAKQVVMPYTNNLRVIMEKLPLHRFLLLYPEEEYLTLHFKYNGRPISE